MEKPANPIKMDDLGGSLIFGNTHFLELTFLSCLKNLWSKSNIPIS